MGVYNVTQLKVHVYTSIFPGDVISAERGYNPDTGLYTLATQIINGGGVGISQQANYVDGNVGTYAQAITTNYKSIILGWPVNYTDRVDVHWGVVSINGPRPCEISIAVDGSPTLFLIATITSYSSHAWNTIMLGDYFPPGVETVQVVGFTGGIAHAYGNLESLGVGAVTAHGFVWGQNPYPTTSDNVVNLGAAAATGPFDSLIGGPVPGVLYYVRAYATNAIGTRYGTLLSFKINSTENVCWQVDPRGQGGGGGGSEDGEGKGFPYHPGILPNPAAGTLPASSVS